MNLYEPHNPIHPIGSAVEAEAIATPSGVSVDPQFLEEMRNVVALLGLREVGIVTPWAERRSDVEWVPIVKPDTNVAMFSISQAQVNQATMMLFGRQLPFLTIYTQLLQPHEQVKSILNGSSYELFQTQAVYRQDDPNPIPAIGLLHWVRVRDLPSLPSSPKSMDAVASEMGGQLMFSQQVPVESTTIRPMPDIPLEAVTDLLRSIPMPGQIPPLPLPGGVPQLPFPVPGVPTPPPNLFPFPIDMKPPPGTLPFPIPDRMVPFEEQQAKQRSMVGPLLLGVGMAYVIYTVADRASRRRR